MLFLFDEPRHGYYMSGVVTYGACRIRSYNIRATRLLCRCHNDIRDNINGIVLRIGQVYDIAKSLNFYRDTGDIAGIRLLSRHSCYLTGRLKCRAVRDSYSVRCAVDDFSHLASSLSTCSTWEKKIMSCSWQLGQ